MNEFVITTQRPKHVVYKLRNPVTGQESSRSTKAAKYLCIGGTFDGQFKASVELRIAKLHDHYDGFNFAEYWARHRLPGGGWDKNPHSKIWVWSDLLVLP